jgi:hypothetical protein
MITDVADSIEVNLHDSQALIQIINANTTYCAWPRGGGKTGGGIGPRFLRLSEVMPRSQTLLVSDTYERLWNRIVPNFTNFLEDKLGLIEGVDFIRYKRPPESWQMPLIKLDKFDNVISFASGMAVCLVSLHVEGSANAFTAQSAIIDEAKYCKEEKIDTEVLPALRGAKEHFEHLPEYLSVWMFTDKFGPNIKWYLKKREKVNHDAVQMVYAYQMKIFELQKEMRQYTSSTTISEYKKKIIDCETKANKLRKHLVYFSDMKAYENLKTLGEFYFKRQRRICRSQLEYEVAIENKDPDKVEHCFYPTFTQLNKYKGVDDYDPLKCLFTAMDYNFRISPMPLSQIGKLGDSVYTTVNVIDYVYALYPGGIEDAVNEFSDKYEKHVNKTIHYIYDHTAIGRNPTKQTFKDVFINTFKLRGWIVVEHYTGDAPDHEIKFENIKALLLNQCEYAIRINEIKCDVLIKSIEQSPATIVNGVTKKDKKTEKDLNFPAEESTHGSDAFDQLLWGLFEFNIKDQSSSSFIPIRTR